MARLRRCRRRHRPRMFEYQPRHQADQRLPRVLRQVGPIGRHRRARACKQIHLSGSVTRLAPPPRSPTPSSSAPWLSPRFWSRELHMRPEAGHSMMARWSSTLGRATRTMRQALPDRRTRRPQSAPRTRIRRDRTSRPEFPTTALCLNRPMCSGKRHCPCRSRRGRNIAPEPRMERSCGRS